MLIIKNCRLMDMVSINGEIMDILIDDEGKIEAIEKKINMGDYPNAEIINAKKRLVTPGFIEPHCHMGVYETAVREGMDGNENTNPTTPQLRAIDAIDPMDSAYDVAIRHGVTTVVAGPGSANIIGGTFAAMKTHGNILDNSLIKSEVCMKMALGGENPKLSYGRRNKAPSTRMMSAAMMREQLFKAKEYYEKFKEYRENQDKSKGFDYDLGLHSLMRVFHGMRVKIHAHQADDILTAIRIAEEFNLRYTIDHCTEGYLIVDELKKKNVQCIIGPSVGGRGGKFESRNKSLESAAILEREGIDFAIMTDHPVIPIEGQTMQLALFVKYGLSREAALKGITINAARLTDIDNRVGSIEIGKDGDIVIWDIDPLDTMSQVAMTIIDGKVVYENKRSGSIVDYKNCNLINMTDIYEETMDIRVENGEIVEIGKSIDLDKYFNAQIIDAENNFVTPGIVEPHSEMGVREQIYRFEGNDANEGTDPILPQLRL